MIVLSFHTSSSNKSFGATIDEKMLAQSATMFLCLLYFMAGFWKLNDDFLDVEVSCGSQTMSMVVSQWVEPMIRSVDSLLVGGDSPNLLETHIMKAGLLWIIKYAGYGALLSEMVLLPFSLLLCKEVFLVLGIGFHIFLAFPLPPSSYFPFSMVSLALYPLVLTEAQSTVLFSRLNLSQKSGKAVSSSKTVFLKTAAVLGCFLGLLYWLFNFLSQQEYFEYPAYNLYAAGTTWCVGFGCIVLI